MDNQLSEAERKEIEFDLNCARDDAAERVRNQMHFADKGLAAMVIANGGALIALFTFIGNTVGKSDVPLRFATSFLWAGFAAFALGISCCLMAHILAFFSQHRYYHQAVHEVWRMQRSLRQGFHDKDNSREVHYNASGDRYFVGGMTCMVAALICFVAGSGLALAGVLPK